MLIDTGPPLIIGPSERAVLRFGEASKSEGSWAGRRLMWLGDDPAFELSFWCGTCQFLFKRLEGANETLSLPEVAQQLTAGLDQIDAQVVEPFAALLSEGTYLPMLLRVQPELIMPGRPGDYFSEDQVATWGLSGFWGLPENPQTPYYRTWQTGIDADAHLFEFVVPMVPPAWNDEGLVREHAARLTQSSAPTAVAVSILDVCQPATTNRGEYSYQHWGLTHFLLDGHHKMQAAAESARSLQLLSLLSVGDSLATRDQVHRVADLRGRAAGSRLKP